MMEELALIVVGGVLGSSHCIGMCGGFALSIGLGSSRPHQNLARQLLYSAGRIFTYGILGSSAGFAALWFTKHSTPLVNAQAALSIAAGLLLIGLGLKSLRPWCGSGRTVRWRGRPNLTCPAHSFLGPLLNSPNASSMLIAGMLNGLLPCGLVYGYLALASSRASLFGGLVTMIAFGLGTVPLMVLSGLGASVLSRVARQRLFFVSAVCVLITGFVTVGRGVHSWRATNKASCPACHPTDSPRFDPLVVSLRRS